MHSLASMNNDRKAGDAGDRSIQIDMMRMACVLVWVVRHGNQQFHESNIILDQNWSAPLLWLISGMCWARSRTPLWIYIGRLALYFFIGTALNAFAWWMQNKIGHADVWNIVFHMWFVAGLMVMSCITAPLKAVLEARAEEKNVAIIWSFAPPFFLTCAAIAVYMTAGLQFQIPIWQGLGWWLHGGSTSICIPLLESAVTQMLAVYAFACPPEAEHGGSLIGWVLLAYIPGTLVIYQHSRVGVEFAAMNLFVLGIVVERQGLRGRRIVGKVVTGYWLLLVLACSWLAIPFIHGAIEIEPSEDLAIRARWSAITAIFLVAFACAGDVIQDPLHLFARFPGLKYWVAFLYMAHIAIHKLAPSPLNWMILAASVLPFLLMHSRLAAASPEEAKPILGTSKSAQDV